MRRRQPSQPQPERKQPTPPELVTELLRFIEVKFYQGEHIAFLKERRHLLGWVVFKLASYLDDRGVTIQPARYLEIMHTVLMDAVRYGRTGEIHYRPAWLGRVIDLHLAHHGEAYYTEGKHIQAVIDRALFVRDPQRAVAAADPVRELASASKLLTTQKRPVKQPPRDQLKLL